MKKEQIIAGLCDENRERSTQALQPGNYSNMGCFEEPLGQKAHSEGRKKGNDLSCAADITFISGSTYEM